MKIKVNEFYGGVVFTLVSENDTERTLLTACVDGELLKDSEEDDEFKLTLSVSM